MKTPDSMLFLGGGGTKEQSAPLDAAFVERIKQTRGNLLSVAYIPVAMEQRQDKYPYPSCLEWFRGTFENQIEEIEMWTDLTKLSLADLQSKGAVYVGGGDTDVLLEHMQSSGFDALLKQFIQEGGTYYGGSAGAIILGKDIRTSEEVRSRPQPILESFEGLDLIHGYSVFPHFNSGKDALSAGTAKRLVGELNSPIIAIPETSGVVVNDGKIRIVGTDAVTLFTAEGETELQPDENQSVDIPVL